MSARRTAANGSSFWPTATATERENDTTATPSEGTLERYAAGEIARVRKTRAPTLLKAVAMWPTPRVTDTQGAGEHGDGGNDLRTEAEQWQMPGTDSFRSRGGEYVDEAGLDRQARMWRSPTSRDWKGESAESWRTRETGDLTPTLADKVLSLPLPTTPKDGQPSSESAPTSRRRLNPLFVEWLMGWPIGWTSLAPLGSGSPATESSRSRRRSRGAS